METATSEDGSLYSFGYDEYGNNTTVSIVDGNVRLTSSVVYTADGNRQWKAVDAAGKTTEYSYNEQTNILEWVKYPNDTDATKTTYTYDNMYRLASTAATTDMGKQMSASYTYEDDLLTSIETPTTTYTFAYGNFALRSQVKVGSRTLATYTYTGRNNDLQRLDYGNGDYVQYEYNEQGQITKETFEDGSTLSYKYDNNGVLATVTDSATGRTATYYYDFTDRLMRYVENGNGFEHTVGYEYDTINNLTKRIETINGVASETTYAYDKDNRITGITTNLQAGTEGTSTDGSSRTYAYDAFSRIESQTTKHNGTEVLEETFTYLPNGTDTTGQVGTYKITTANGTETEYRYSYDNNGNISTITDGLKTITYQYDSANQLIREDNELTGTTTTWEYDNAGNILSRKEYLHTTDAVLGTPLDTVTYTYGDATWGDLLTAYNGQTISYDTIGNPLSDGTWNYTWQHGRQMAGMTDGTVTWNYSYNADGLRTQRTNGNTTYAYVYSGDKLSQMTVGNNVLRFAYDASGKPMSVDYNGTIYYYLTNLQGDVTGIVDSNGTNVASYVYDAWGNLLNESAIPSGIGQLNPLRYRGYVYDNETSLYYLQSRYYNPTTGRFLNADAFAATGQGLLGNNMFAYCLNNPIILCDPQGICAYCSTEYDRKRCENYRTKNANNEPNYEEKVIETLEAIATSFTGSVGIGYGLYGSVTHFDTLGLGFGVYMDMLHLEVSNGEFSYRSYAYSGGNFSIGFVNFELGDETYFTDGCWEEWTSAGGSWDITSAGGYFFGGASYSLSFDILSFIEKYNKIWYT